MIKNSFLQIEVLIHVYHNGYGESMKPLVGVVLLIKLKVRGLIYVNIKISSGVYMYI